MTQPTPATTTRENQKKETYTTPELVVQELLRDVTACFAEYECFK